MSETKFHKLQNLTVTKTTAPSISSSYVTGAVTRSVSFGNPTTPSPGFPVWETSHFAWTPQLAFAQKNNTPSHAKWQNEVSSHITNDNLYPWTPDTLVRQLLNQFPLNNHCVTHDVIFLYVFMYKHNWLSFIKAKLWTCILSLHSWSSIITSLKNWNSTCKLKTRTIC